ncbi:MAG: hypothetical protein MUE87_02660 [Methanothrix sp.]|nr:hypothetical protein [Methanothrix sp.]
MAFLLFSIGIISLALISPISGNMMGQCLNKDCETMMGTCPDNMTCMMMQSMMGTCPANKTCLMMQPMMGTCPANKTCVMMQPMTGTCPANKTCVTIKPIMGTCPDNMTCMILEPVVGECPSNGTCYIAEQFQNASSTQTRLDCARFWLEKAMELHDLHLRDSSTTTNDSQIELMDQITKAFECVTGENVTSYERVTVASEQVPLDEHGH